MPYAVLSMTLLPGRVDMHRLLIASFSLLMLALQAWATEQNLPPSISVTGTGKVSGKPDMASIDVGVTSQATTAKQALAVNSTSMTTLVAAVKDHGVAEKDVQTSNFSVNPVYTNDSSGRNARITGYQVTNQVHLRVRNLAGLGDLLDAIVQNGANSVNGISFYIENADKLMDTARGKAVEDAHRKAVLYAGAAGVKLGRVLYINESGGYSPPTPGLMMHSYRAAAASTPIEIGEEEMQSNINVVYAIE